jgi:hypothetical protein
MKKHWFQFLNYFRMRGVLVRVLWKILRPKKTTHPNYFQKPERTGGFLEKIGNDLVVLWWVI